MAITQTNGQYVLEIVKYVKKAPQPVVVVDVIGVE
jgi:hypothetical protein